MKRLIWIVLLLSLTGLLFADAPHLQKMDARLRMRLASIKQADLKPGPFMTTQSDQVRIILKGSDPAGAVNKIGGTVHTKIGDFATARVPLEKVEDLALSANVEFIQMSRKVKLQNDQAAIYSEADKVRSGTAPLSMAYDGTGVVVGIIDTGIDFSHGDFKNADGSTRILAVWDQNAPSAGNAPAGYDYGREWTQAQINLGFCTHTDTDGHGTHVAGSAAGNGLAIGAHTGMAPRADIIMVATSFATTDIIDGASYIYTKAAALGRPCVINASLGGHMSPHDGTSLESQLLDALIAANNGQAFCASAGNEGSDYIHMTYPNADSSWTYFHAAEDQYAFLFIRLPESVKNTMKMRIGWNTSTYNPYTGAGGPGPFVGQTEWITPAQIISAGQINHIARQGANQLGQIAFAQNTDANGIITLVIQIWDDMTWLANSVQDMELWRLIVEGANSNVDVWIADIGYPYLNSVAEANYLMPDNNKTVGWPGVANNVLTVGAYVSRTQWQASDGNTYWYGPEIILGDLAYFSSLGPSADGRLKPEITAPGMFIISAFSSATAVVEQERLVDGEKHYVLQGTSMSSPITAGCIALFLQANPAATYAEVKQAVTGYATNDAFTGSLPNNTWGHGKLNIFSMLTTNSVEDNPLQPRSFELFAAYPNPFNPTATILYQLPTRMNVKVSIYNAVGQLQDVLVHQWQSAGRHQVHVDGSDWSSGVYLCKIEAANQIRTTKMVLMK